MRHSLLALAFVAATITPAAAGHLPLKLQPDDLGLGDQYRLAFLTSTIRDALSSNIDDYNDFVQAVADTSPVAVLGQTWNAIASTVPEPSSLDLMVAGMLCAAAMRTRHNHLT